MRALKRLKLFVLIVPTLFLYQSCGVYTLNGASIPAEMKTVTVEFFENSAPIVVSYLSQEFTEALKDRIRTQTRLSQVDSDGDGVFEGRITGYSIAPAAVGGNNDRAELNRLSITVQIKYTNKISPDDDFEQGFTRFLDFPGPTATSQSQEADLIRRINVMLTEDIFNRAFANW